MGWIIENGLVIGTGVVIGVVITVVFLFAHYPSAEELHNSRWVSKEYGWKSWFKYAWLNYVVYPLSLVGIMQYPDD